MQIIGGVPAAGFPMENAQVTSLAASGTASDLLAPERDKVPIPPIGVEVCGEYSP